MPKQHSRSNSPMRSSLEDVSNRRNPRRGSTKVQYEDDGAANNDDDGDDYDANKMEEDDEDDEMEVDDDEEEPKPRIRKRGKSFDEPVAGGRRSSRSTKFQASLKEPPSESIRDLFESPSKKSSAKTAKSPAASHKAVRRKVHMEVEVSSAGEYSDEESDEDEEEDVGENDDLKIERVIAARSEKRSKWIEICKKINTTEIENGSRWHEEEDEVTEENDTFEERFLVKWYDLSYLHSSWETQDDLVDQIDNAKSYLRTFFRKSVEGFLFTPDERCDGDYFDPSYTQIERILEVEVYDQGKEDNWGMIMDRNDPDYDDGTGRQFLVKWGSTPYDNNTYEFERDLIVNDIEYEPQLEEFFKRSKKPTKSAVKSFFAEGEREVRRLYKFFGDNSKLTEENRNKEIAAYQKILADRVYPNGGQLRDYQAEGVSWMMANYVNKRSSLLADEMGLGKTLQTCSFINLLANQLNRRGPFLIVAPLSTIEHWKREFQTWTDLNTIVYHGSAGNREQTRECEFAYEEDRPPKGGVGFNSSFLKKCHNKKKPKLEKLWMAQVVVTTPEMLVTDDYSELTAVEWDAVVVDEAHRLKSHTSKLATNLRDSRFHFGYTLLLTGTPIQNNMTELWSLLNVIDPEGFSDLDEFLESYGDMKSKEGIDALHENIRPYILRRLKEDVEKSVPPKEETLIEVELTTLQKQYYRALYEKNVGFLHKNKKKALDGPSLNNLAMQLRKCCNHPFLLNGVEDDVRESDKKKLVDMSEADFVARYSGKLILLDKLLPRLENNGHRVLIFSQFKIMLDILEDYLHYRQFKAERIDGSITGKKRQQAIDRFQAPATEGKETPFIMMLSTRAGGVGINLTAADTCIIFDSDWNPQNDLQAQARCHRIGQTKSVKVYRLLTRKTYEMQMFHMSSLKMGLDQAVLQGFESGAGQGEGALSKEEVEKLLRHGAYDIFNEEKAGTTDAESNAFIEQDIDSILARRAKTVVHENTGSKSSAAGGTFSKASFKAAKTPTKGGGGGEAMDVDVDDPDFWTKMVGEAKMDDSDDMTGKKRKRKVANYSDRAYATQLENQLKERFNESDSSQSDEEINEDDFASDDDDESAGSDGVPRKKRKREFSKWGRKGSLGWKRADVEKLSKGLQTFGYGNMSWEDVRAKFDLSGYECAEIQRMSWSLILVTLSEIAKESVVQAQRKEEKATQRRKMKEAEDRKGEAKQEVADVSGGVLAMQHNGEATKKVLESHFRAMVNNHKPLLVKVLRDARAYAITNTRRPMEMADRFISTPNKKKQHAYGQQNALFAQNLWPQLKNRGWKVEHQSVDGNMSTKYIFNSVVFKSPESVMASLPVVHPELSAIVEEVQQSMAAVKKRDEEENSSQLSLLETDSISAESLERYLSQFAPLQLIVDRATTQRLHFMRKLLTTCSTLYNAHDIVQQAKASTVVENVVEGIARSLTIDKRKLLPQPAWTGKHDAVLILAIAKHGWIEHDACCRAITEDKSIKWGPPFDSKAEKTETVAAPKVNFERVIRVGERVAKFFNVERECLDSLRDLSEAHLAKTYGLKKKPVSEENTTATWEVDEDLLRENHGGKAVDSTEGDGGMVDLPTKKDLVKRAKALLLNQIKLIETAPEPEAAVVEKPDYGYCVLDRDDASNAFLAELMRVLIKVSFNNSGKRRILGKRLMNAAINEAKNRTEDLEGLDPKDTEAIEGMKKIGEHCAFAHRFIQNQPVQSKNVLRVVLGTVPVSPKHGTNLFPINRTLALESLADKKDGSGKPKEKKARQRRKRNKGASGDVAISDAMSKVAEDEATIKKLMSDGGYVQLSAPETLLLTVICSQGLPIWTENWYDMIDPANLVPENQGPGFQHAISWWGMGGVFEAAANVWHHTAELKWRSNQATFAEQFSSVPDSDPNKQEAAKKLDALFQDEARKRISLAIAGDYKNHPEKLAKKCIMLLESLRNHMGNIQSSRKQLSSASKLNKSENGLGPFVLEWLSSETRRWAESLKLIDGTGHPLSYTAADFKPNAKQDKELHSIAALIDKKGCRTVFAQVAQQSRVRQVFLKNSEIEVKSLLKIAVLNFANETEWEEKPLWWGKETMDEDATASYSIQHDHLILDSLLEYGYSGIEETLSQFNEENGFQDAEHKLTRSDIQFRANQLARGLHSLERTQQAIVEVGKEVGKLKNGQAAPPRSIDSYFGSSQCIEMTVAGPEPPISTSITVAGPDSTAVAKTVDLT